MLAWLLLLLCARISESSTQGTLFLFGGWLDLDNMTSSQSLPSSVPISESFLSPAYISNVNNDLRVNLSTSLLAPGSNGSFRIFLSQNETIYLISQIESLATFSTLFFSFANGSSTTLTYHYPNSSQCDSECGAITASNIIPHVLCRRQCVLPDRTGARVPLSCEPQQIFFNLLGECVSSSIAGMPAFLQALSTQRVCQGRTVTTTDDLESLRFCNTINGTLSINVATVGADFTSLFDIRTITGALVVQNSSLVTFASFASISAIDTSGVTVAVSSKPYALVVTGNNQLVDLAYILDIVQFAPLGTLVVNNSMLCFQAALTWSTRRDSRLEFEVAQCGNTSCTLFEVGALCTSACITCGVLCEAFPITDLPSCQLYSSSNCTVIVGDLYVTGLSALVLRSQVQACLKTVVTIRGSLYFQNNLYISSMTSFQTLQSVNSVHYLNNPRLIDARFPALTSLAGTVTVVGCDRLCPARYTKVGPGPDDSGCPNPLLEYYFHIDGPAVPSDLQFLASMIGLILQGSTQNQWSGRTSFSVIESGIGWMNAQVDLYDLTPSGYYISLVRPYVNNQQLTKFAQNASELAFLAANNVSTLLMANYFPDPSLYNSGNELTAAMPQLLGILLQWAKPFPSTSSAFIQYRVVSNRTASLTLTDTTPFTTLPMPFSNSYLLSFLVPITSLSAGAFYEFQLGYQNETYTYFTNSLFAKTYDAASSQVSNTNIAATNFSISVSWDLPSYSVGVIGYDLEVQDWEPDDDLSLESAEIHIFDSFQVSLTQLAVTIICSSINTTNCVQPYTNYTIYISVRREASTDPPLKLSVLTDPASPNFALNLTLQNYADDWAIVCLNGLSTEFGPIISTQAIVLVESTENDVVTPMNGTQSFSEPVIGSNCSQFQLVLTPRTAYSIKMRAWTTAGSGPWSNAVKLTTTALEFATLNAPNIRLLTPIELSALNWTSGYDISWLTPQIDEGDLIRYDVQDDGLSGNASIVYSGKMSHTPVHSIYGSIRVRLVTISGFGNYSTASELPQPQVASTPVAAIVAPVVIFVCIAIVICAIFGRRRYQVYQIYQQRLADIKRRIPPGVLAVLEQINGGNFNVPRDISPISLTFLDTLGEGKFGAVMKAMLDEHDKTGMHGYLVAVKMAKEDAPPEQVEDMRLEAAIMAQFTHPNVLGLVGQVMEGDMFLLVIQYCEHGSLLSWLTDNGPMAAIQTLINMCLDTAAGMEYLSSLHVVHRDLAARNVLLSSDLSCKVSDFGLSRHSEGAVSSEAKDQVAIRWAAPEAISDRRYTSKSDVWSFGILMYEVFTFGKKPYESMKNAKVIEELRKGYRLARPVTCPKPIYDIVEKTWHADPDSRPDFSSLVNLLKSIYVMFEAADLTKSVPTNKLIERFNATKANCLSGSGTSNNIDDNESISSHRHSRNNSLIRPRFGSGALDKLTMSGSNPVSRNTTQNLRQVKKYNSPMTRISTTDQRKPTMPSPAKGSYLALVGMDDKLVSANDCVPTVPPIFQHVVTEAHNSSDSLEEIEVAEQSRVSGNLRVSEDKGRSLSKSPGVSGSDVATFFRGHTLRDQVGLVLHARRRSNVLTPTVTAQSWLSLHDEAPIMEEKSFAEEQNQDQEEVPQIQHDIQPTILQIDVSGEFDL